MILGAMFGLVCLIALVVALRSRRIDKDQEFKDYQNELNRRHLERGNPR